MKQMKIVLFAVAMFAVSVIQAQTVDEIINKYVDAIGGKEKLAQVKSLYTENSVEIMGNKAPVNTWLLEGKGFKSETEFNGSKIIQCFTDKSGWSVNPMMGGGGAEAMPAEMYEAGKSNLYAAGTLVDYAAKGSKAELVGKEGNDYKIKLTSGSAEAFYFMDATTGYINKTLMKGEMMGQPVEITTTFSDYKKTDFGIVLPYTKVVDMGAFSMPFTMTKVEVNKEVDPAIFEMPK
jgi:hypothetical protein